LHLHQADGETLVVELLQELQVDPVVAAAAVLLEQVLMEVVMELLVLVGQEELEQDILLQDH